jgi:hypothetical protein
MMTVMREGLDIEVGRLRARGSSQPVWEANALQTQSLKPIVVIANSHSMLFDSLKHPLVALAR